MHFLRIFLLLLITLYPQVSFSNPVEAYGCRGGFFPSFQDETKAGVITLAEKAKSYFYDDAKGCPYQKSCKQRAYLINGNQVLVGKRQDGWSCVWYNGKRHDFIGWMPSANIKERDDNQTPDISAWLGTWRYYKTDGEISISQINGSRLKVEGTAFWYGANDNVHDGGVEAEGTVKGDRLEISEGDDQYACKVSMKLVGNQLMVTDNSACGGMNVRFNNVYSRTKKVAAKKTQTPPETYVRKHACPGEGCIFGRWRVAKDVELVQAIGSNKVVATVKANEHLTALTGEVHGTATVIEIISDDRGYHQGEKVYVLDYLGEGFSRVWRNGQTIEDDTIDAALTGDATWARKIKEGDDTWWVQFDLGNGKTGWAKGDSFAGYLDNDIDMDDPEMCWELNKEDGPDNYCRKQGMPSPQESKAVCSGMVARGFLKADDCP